MTDPPLINSYSSKMSETTKLKVAVIGAGSFGTVLANIAAHKGHEVRMWMRGAEQAEAINTTHRNPKHLQDLQLHSELTAGNDLAAAISDCDLIIMALPSHAYAPVLQQMLPHISKQYLVSATKGITEDRFCLMSELTIEELAKQGKPQDRVGVLSGPNLAHEIAHKHLTGTVIASRSAKLNAMVRATLSTKYLHVFENEDVYGVELAGALKNVYAIASGISDSLGFGLNTKSVLITRSIAEIARFASHMHASRLTFLGLASIGDLIATCSSTGSRNYKLGAKLKSGRPLEEICGEIDGVVEGIRTTKLTYDKAQELGVSMPVLEGVYRILYKNEKVKNVLWRVLRNIPVEDVEKVDISAKSIGAARQTQKQTQKQIQK